METSFAFPLSFSVIMWYTVIAKPTIYVAKRGMPYGISVPFFAHNGIDKNANSVSVGFKGIPFCRVGLATIGVCVFCAAASVVALFIFWDSSG